MERARQIRFFLVAIAVLAFVLPPAARAQEDDTHRAYILNFQYDMTVQGSWSDQKTTPDFEYTAHDLIEAHLNWTAVTKIHDNQEDSINGYSSALLEVHRVHFTKRVSYNSTHDRVHEDSVSSDCRGSAVSDPNGAEFIVGGSDTKAGVAKIWMVEATDVMRQVDATPCPMSIVEFDVHYQSPLENTTAPMGSSPLLTSASLPGMSEGLADNKLNFTIPLRGSHQVTEGATSPWPGGPHDNSGYYCGAVSDATYSNVPGSCSWKGSLRVVGIPDPCEGAQERYDQALAALKAFGPPPTSARAKRDPYALAAYQNAVDVYAWPVLNTMRQEQLYPCDLDLRDGYAYWQTIIIQIRDAWETILGVNPDDHYASDWLSAERQTELMGLGEGANPPPLHMTPNPDGSLQISLHSPVSVHAYTRDGLHTGWNATTNASEANIPNSSYQGRPFWPQQLTLPGGEYRIVIDELADGKYVLDSSWNSPGVSGEEQFPAESRAGRTTSTYYVLTPNSTGDWSILTGPVVRQTTASAIHGFTRVAASEISFADARAPGAGPGSDTPTDATGPTVATDPAGLLHDAAKGVPASGAAGGILALALVALAARKRS